MSGNNDPVTGRKITVVMPAYNAAKTLHDTYEKIPREFVSEIILVDDASHDDTYDHALRLGLHTIRHYHNLGYGGNQKTCYTEALKRGADVVVMLHPDGQYDPAFLKEIVAPIIEGKADVVLGSRMYYRRKALEGGMPLYKYVSNTFLTAAENRVLHKSLSEYHTGYRAYSRHFLESIPFLRNSNDFVFDTEILVQAVHFGMRIEEIPITTRYFKEASSVDFKTSLIYGLKTLAVLFKYLLHQARIIRCPLFLP
ncbi:MAG TPA: glycosyltransferase family 2 protein [Candidatus Omnitrophota bacterium]|nr:glycosyltransferase family 2 protein [Candidatus Omnitrophota bacterium]